MGYGKSNYSKETFKKTGKPNKGPGDNYIRIMPAMHSLADEGKWAVYYTTHWGYQGTHPTDQSKNIVRPFRCIEDKNRATGMVRQNCPECDLYNTKFKEAEAFEAQLKAQKLSDDEIKTKMKSRADWLQAHAPERKWYINVMLKDRTFQDYKINHKTHKTGIDAKIKELLDKNEIDATDLDTGVWFNIKRTGDGFSTPDTIEVEREMVDAVVDGKKTKVERIVSGRLTDEEQARGLKECRDLATLGGAVLTYNQIRELTLSGGDPDKVDRIFGGRLGGTVTRSQAASRQDEPEDGPVEESTGGLKAEVETKFVPANETKVETKVAAPAGNQAEIQARVQKILAERKAKAEAEAKAKAEAEAAAKAAEEVATAGADQVNPLDMDDETFMRDFGGDTKTA